MKKRNLGKYFGPGTLIAAAFIGPGTLTTCTLAGVKSGYGLLWVLVLAILATILLQEMSARLGFVTGRGLGEAMALGIKNKWTRYFSFAVVIGAVIIGNAAYESGNLSGAVLGIELLHESSAYWPWVVGLVVFIFLFLGKYKWIESFLVALVLLMSVCFFITAIIVKPDIGEVLQGFLPGNFQGHIFLIMGLVGTTIVPYNLFLHATAVTKKYSKDYSLADVRLENIISITFGGIVSILIVITAAATRATLAEVNSAADLAVQLTPFAGPFANVIMGTGLLAAGLSSAITAPLAAAWAANGIFGKNQDETSFLFRSIWMLILFCGLMVSITGINFIMIIKFAQVMNAILLPFIAIFLIYLCNKKQLLGQFINSATQNILAAILLALVLLLSMRSLWLVIQSL